METEISLGSLIAKTEPKQLDSFLATVTKYEKLMDKGMAIIEKLNKMGVLPAVIRGIGEKQGIKDIGKPLTNPLALEAATASHRMLYLTLNEAPEEAVIEMFKQATTATAEGSKTKKEEKDEPGKNITK